MGARDRIEEGAGAQPGDGELDELVLRAGTDRAALGRLLRALGPHVRRAVRARLRRGPRDDEDDVVQEALVRVVEHFGRFQPPGTEPYQGLVRWACAIGRQVAQIHQDRARSTRTNDGDVLDALEDGSADVVDEVLAGERGRVVREAISKLPEPWRDALTMRFIGHASMKEIAFRLGRPSEGAARQLVQRALRALRERLERGPVPRGWWPRLARLLWPQPLAPPLLLSDNPIISLA